MFWEELKKFLFLNLNDYPNIEINFPIIFFYLCLVVALSVIFFLINQKNMYIVYLLKQIIRHEAKDEDSALTLNELGVKNGILLRSMLSQKTGKLTSIVCRVGDTSMTYEQYLINSKEKGYKEAKIDFSSARFYIPDEKRAEADKILDKDTSSKIKPVLTTLLIIAIFSCLAIVTPDLLTYLSDALGK